MRPTPHLALAPPSTEWSTPVTGLFCQYDQQRCTLFLSHYQPECTSHCLNCPPTYPCYTHTRPKSKTRHVLLGTQQAHTHARTHARTHTHTNIYTYIRTYTYTYTHTRTSNHTTYICTHTHSRALTCDCYIIMQVRNILCPCRCGQDGQAGCCCWPSRS